MNDPTPFTFETAFARLEEILEKMNSGKVSLEESLKLFEEAQGLMKTCSEKLSSAEQKIETLLKQKDGEPLKNDDGSVQKEALFARENP